ncbi:long-chain fatty acid--CoA ligase [Amycolatopsis acidicola]|uniref:Long-chain fatty acid--CoA ligase n=1 Tax=Amycolatopsis acidicola TaxID=2596893 RepID=A0A5N0UWD4_9PSEU|nr:AMP-binding protein [Amycolatopsis acidicola]KAA9156329.1 long-chain fatty acid--CoA ligase [Amycolatopsis acidicola]
MNPSLLLEMVADAAAGRRAVGELTYGELDARASAVAGGLAALGIANVGYLDEYSETLPVLFYAAHRAGLPFVPLNYRLSDEALRAALARIAPAVVVAGARQRERCAGVEGITVLGPGELPTGDAVSVEGEVSVLLFTSGTSGEPKAAVLRPENLTSYVLSTVDFLGAGEDEAQLISVPPYHIAGVSSVLTSLFAGRRLVVLPSFSPGGWVDAVVAESVTHAMVVPTMLGRILDVAEERGTTLPALRHLSYGGGRMPAPVIERALHQLPHVDFVNAYGLTETSSTIAVLGPDDHRAAIASADPAVRARLMSVGRPLPSVEVEIRGADGLPTGPGEPGEIFVRGDQVSGEYVSHTATDADGWFPTRDRGYLDAEGFLFLDGRADDVIVRGGENLSPGEIEDALLSHPAVDDVIVLGMPDGEWGEVPVAAVVPATAADPAELERELREYVRERLRSAKTPARVHVRESLPHTETGKALRRVLRAELMGRDSALHA